MKQILILGAIPSDGNKYMMLYSQLVSLCKNYAEEVYSPLDTKEFKGSAQERYDRAIRLVSTSELIIGELSAPSTGEGMEIQEACRCNIPLIIIAQKGNKVSELVRGVPILEEIVYYDTVEDLQRTIKAKLEELSFKSST